MRFMALFVFVTCSLSLFGTAHAMPGSENQRKAVGSNTAGSAAQGTVVSPHGASNAVGSVSQGMVDVIKNATLPGYGTMKIGDAFGKHRHFKNKEWKETRAANGTTYVDFIGYNPSGWFDFKAKRAGISARGIEVKFVIYPGGAYGVSMVSKVEMRTNGKTYRYPSGDVKKVLDDIYANRKINP